jgi:23S rRNA pseudouridine2605 synthase
MSRRAADQAIQDGRVFVDGEKASLSAQVSSDSSVSLDGKPLEAPTEKRTIMLNKPRGYVVSRDGQGSKTIYDLLPEDMQNLKPVGRLDKDSSGLLLLTNDGELAHKLTHPSFKKIKIYNIATDKPLQPLHRQMISDMGVQLEDGPSRLLLERIEEGDDTKWRVTMHEGRNRQIRRTFAALGYDVVGLHRISFGDYQLDDLASGAYRAVNITSSLL